MEVVNSTNQFTFFYNRGSTEVITEHAVPIPLNVSVQEFGCKCIKDQKIPMYIEKDFLNELEKFVVKATNDYYCEKSSQLIRSYKNETFVDDKIVEKWSQAFREEYTEYSKPEELTDEVTFPEMYHSLIHSPALETMLNLEHTYALAVGELVQAKDKIINQLLKRQSEEMEKAVQQVGITFTDRDINDIATRHFEETQKATEKWENKINNLKNTQRKEFHEWVRKVHEDSKNGSGPPGYLQRVRALSEAVPNNADSSWTPQPHYMEESFTIHLGSQLKVMHNLRLLSADVLDLCRHKLNKISGMVVPQPQRLQTAISLYSNNLCGLVLLVDNRVSSYTGIKRDFASVCQHSTELHFGDIEEQLEIVRERAKQASEWRLVNGFRAECESQGSGSRSSETMSDHQVSSPTLKTGDFYITRHSNLSEVHIVFHLVSDDTLRSAEINSRHPVILGLRNILRVAHERDICTITIPLLLVHEMSEEMTIPWCMKRAELVFKCIKGFMIEMASLTGDETRTVQFLVPKGISEELFSGLSTMLPSIFRVSNPLVLKS